MVKFMRASWPPSATQAEHASSVSPGSRDIFHRADVDAFSTLDGGAFSQPHDDIATRMAQGPAAPQTVDVVRTTRRGTGDRAGLSEAPNAPQRVSPR